MNQFKSNVRAPQAEAKAAYFTGRVMPFHVTYTPVGAGVFNVYLFGEIEVADQFINAIEVLNQATENDLVVIHLSTNGGSLDATDTFITAMQESAAKVVVKASGGVHSAGTKILLSCDEFYLSENFNALIHNGYCGAYTKTSDFVAQSAWTIKYMNKVMNETYEGFLSPEEIQQLIEGKDFWFDADEFLARANARTVLKEGQMAEGAQQFMAMLEELNAQALAEEADVPVTPKKPRKPKAK